MTVKATPAPADLPGSDAAGGQQGRRRTHIPRRIRIPPNMFGIPFGITGLAATWRAAAAVLGVPLAVAGPQSRPALRPTSAEPTHGPGRAAPHPMVKAVHPHPSHQAQGPATHPLRSFDIG